MESDLSKTLTGMAVSLGKIQTRLETNTALTEKIAAAVYGTNGEGMKIKIALNRSSIKRLWWLVGPMVLIIIGAGIRALIK